MTCLLAHILYSPQSPPHQPQPPPNPTQPGDPTRRPPNKKIKMRLPLPLLLGALPLALARDPLNDILSSLIFTLFSHDPTTLTLRLSSTLLSTENNAPIPLGTSPLWQHAVETPATALLPWGPQHRHVDFSTGQAVAVTTVLLEDRDDLPAILVMRVRITERNEVSEAGGVFVCDGGCREREEELVGRRVGEVEWEGEGG
ncbi:hypothetical protein B0T18DRAFT_3757 [Schizothecium vesticola]|uniref:Uncharacterized protein n=1 Tax=Schizothecium vesticola TaxID=314040 RepID=A0AA40KBI6_9PEZI|nr:hypothetical protein B0T18DRAFT_3757 [Schizothecium vesticola]